MQGYESYNKFKNNLKDSKQLYDITYHLYISERQRLKKLLKSNKKINPTLLTSIGSIEHSPTSLYQRLESLYPFKLRQLILISTITALEVYLTDVILEIFERDISPFKKDEPATFQKNYLLNLSSIQKLQKDIISKDFRNLTSGGLTQIEKYYKKMFDIDLKNLGVSFKEIEEIHIRRHLFVHRNGVTDNEYVRKFPQFGFRVAEQIHLEHDYLIESLNKISDFAGKVNNQIIAKFPDKTRQTKYHIGTKGFDTQLKNFMIEMSILESNFDHVDYLNNISVRGVNMSEYIVQIATIEKTCLLFICGKQSELSSFFYAIKGNEKLSILKTIELKK
ncbi:hypothetical protein [Dokdonia sp. R86516]|uniref:hypothetical protein n=1 Tax=Dokdonia sp. R86516 TaxID=3093856 RepID=UPI0037C74C0D